MNWNHSTKEDSERTRAMSKFYPDTFDYMTHMTSHDTHTSNLGFQLDSIATLGRKVRERKGAWVRSLELLNIVSLGLQFTNARQLTAAKEKV